MSPKVVCVAVRTGALVDQVIFCFDNGTYTVYGHTGGNIPTRWNLNDGDYIVQINVRQGCLLDAIQFVTARGKVSPFFGGRGGHYKEFRVDSGCEVVGLLMQRNKPGEEYPVANGVVAGLVSRAVGGAIPPIYLLHSGLRQLDAGCSPSKGYTYDGVRDTDQKESKVVVYRSDLEQTLKNRGLDPDVKDAIVKILDYPGKQFVGKIKLGQIVNTGLQLRDGTLPEDLIKEWTEKGIKAGLQSFIRESLQTNKDIAGGIAGVLLAHIAAPIYAARGEGEKAAKLAAGAMIGLGAAIIGGTAGFGIGLIAPLAIAAIFKQFGETGAELGKRWKQDMYQKYLTFSEPLGEELSRVKDLKCPNGHYLIDEGPPTLDYLDDQPPFRQSCNSGISRDCCTRDKRWQFRTVRFYCPYCALCYCEPCMLSHIRDGKALPPRVLWK